VQGLTLKVDGYQHIEFGTVYRGHRKVSDDEVVEMYGGTHIPLHIMNDFYGHAQGEGSLQHYLDMFSQPEVTLLADIIEYLQAQNKSFHPAYIANDCKLAMAEVHRTGEMHSSIMSDLSRYLTRDGRVGELLKLLKDHGKNLFVVTNSPYPFVDMGMEYIVGDSWKDLFDVVIVRARKPSFFMNLQHPFRLLNCKTLKVSWDRVKEFKKGEVYTEGNVQDFMRLTGWTGKRVLYFGDHVYTDLADPIQKFGWNTGAIVPELEGEVAKGNSDEYKAMLSELLTVDSLLRAYQCYGSSEVRDLIEEWKVRRNVLREGMKVYYNPRFGSMFRTRRGSSYFTRRLIRLANIYTSRVTNLLNYPLDYAFYSRRFALPHEVAISFDMRGTPIEQI
jgi:HAD superfamily 5'-nucleotidase-like hydrolase